jgi:signal peptidase I
MDDAQSQGPQQAPAPQINPPENPRHLGGTGGVKETIESILVAFILAFIFRAFVVEAFVIPTGSMAPTLMGAHMRFHCPDCGYAFDVNFPTGGSGAGEDLNIPANAGKIRYPVYCPNCGFEINEEQMQNPAVYYGDRILVLKYLYLLQPPQRWDVVVFKSPVDPNRDNYTVNYIKRLIGKPGEAVMVLDGDVYIRPPSAKSPTEFTVQTKPKYVQDALWRLVYDNDYRPQQHMDRGNVRPFQMPWAVADGSGWNVDNVDHGRTLAFDNTAGSARLEFDPNANPTAQTLSDYLVYDLPIYMRQPRQGYPEYPETPVSDLDLRATYQRTKGDGPLTLTLTKRDHAFNAIITRSEAVLQHQFGGQTVTIGHPFSIPPSSRPIRIELSNCDYQVTLRIDGEIAAQSTPADYSPDFHGLLDEYRRQEAQRRHNERMSPAPAPHVEIAASQQACQLSHVSLWRDVYYYNSYEPVFSGIWWATPHDFPNNAQVLGPDEYFVMGDNSRVSLDARCWTDPIRLSDSENLDVEAGRVPGRFLLGKAFFVYWPAGFRAMSGWPAAFVPNFGDMRIIH